MTAAGWCASGWGSSLNWGSSRSARCRRRACRPGPPPISASHFRRRAVFELVETRFAGAAADRPDLKLADLQITAGLVPGSGDEAWDGRDFGPLSAQFRADADTVLDGETEAPGGSALANPDLLLRHLGRLRGGLQPGQTMIAGAVCRLPWFEPGTDLPAEIAELGQVAVSLVQAPASAIRKAV